jgi:tetratricopeptide (TPR) repeat protein/glycosyltransferase involved in cell wall biosynthesis
MLNPGICLVETGTIRSYHEKHESTRHISQALGSRGKLLSIDINPESIRISRDICSDAENVEWILSDSVSFLSTRCPEPLHFVLLDSVNEPETIFTEFSLVAPKMALNGILMVDDAGIRIDGKGVDHTEAKKGHLVWKFLKKCNASFDILETVPGHSSQLKVVFNRNNRRRICNYLNTFNGDQDKFGLVNPQKTNPAFPDIQLSNRPSRAHPIESNVPSGKSLHRRRIVIDGVIFQLQANMAQGISRVWKNQIKELVAQLPDTEIIVLQRQGYDIPIKGLSVEIVPPYELNQSQILDNDDEMLRKICHELKADLFISTYYTRAPGIPNIVMIHDMIPEIFGYDLSAPEWDSKRRAIDTADGFIFVSNTTRDDFSRFYPWAANRSAIVAYNGVDRCFSPVEPTRLKSVKNRFGINRPYIVLVGRRHGYKNGVACLGALSRLTAAERPDVLCIGGESFPGIQEKAFENQLQVHHFAQVDDDDLAAIYSGALALCVPSKYEGFGLPLIEAMSCDCPVIAQNSPAIEEIGGDAVIRIDFDSDTDLSRALEQVKDPQTRSAIIDKGRHCASDFNWTTSAGDIGRFINHKSDKSSRLISAIVSTYNAEAFIVGCLEDLENQTISDQMEIIVIDSASEQSEGAIVRDFQHRFENIKYVRTQNRESVYQAWNRGIKLAVGKYLTNANTDDRHRRDALEKMVGILEKNSEVALVYADVVKTQTANETFDHCTPTGILRWPDWKRNTLLNKGCIIGPQPVWRKALHEEYGYFNERYLVSADYEFWMRVSQTHDFYHISEALGLYLERSDSVEHANTELKHQEDQKIFLDYINAAKQKQIIRQLNKKDDTDDQVIKASSTNDGQNLHRLIPGNAKNKDNDIHRGGKGMNAPDTILRTIDFLMSHGHKEVALWVMSKLIEEKPDNAMLHNELAMMAYELGDVQNALVHFQRAVELDPDNGPFHKNLGDFYYTVRQDSESALDQYSKALGVDPRNTECLIMAGHVSISLHRYSDAQMYYQGALELDPGNDEVRQILEKMTHIAPQPQIQPVSNDELYSEAQSKAQAGDIETAKELLNQIVTLESAHALAHNDLGVLFYETGDMARAREYYETAVSLEPQNEIFQKNLADFLWNEMGDHTQAMMAYVQVLKLNPQDIEALLSCSQICLALGKTDDAKDFINTALTIEPWNTDAQGLFSDLNNKSDGIGPEINSIGPPKTTDGKAPTIDLTNAMESLKQKIAAMPQDAQAYNDLGVLSFESGDKEAALENYEKAVRYDPGCANFSKNLADFYVMEMGRYEDAMKLYLNVLEDNPDDIEALNAIGIVCSMMGKGDDANYFFRRVLEIEPWNETAQEGMNRNHGQGNRYGAGGFEQAAAG